MWTECLHLSLGCFSTALYFFTLSLVWDNWERKDVTDDPFLNTCRVMLCVISWLSHFLSLSLSLSFSLLVCLFRTRFNHHHNYMNCWPYRLSDTLLGLVERCAIETHDLVPCVCRVSVWKQQLLCLRDAKGYSALHMQKDRQINRRTDTCIYMRIYI